MAGNPKVKNLSRTKTPDFPDSNHVLLSGDSAQYSGIYALQHNAAENQYDEVFVRKGTKLPYCQDCGSQVKFKLLKKINYISEDPDFQQ